MSVRTCLTGDCGGPAHARGLCNACYKRAKKAGELDRYGRRRWRTFEESFALARRAETDEGCWPWPIVGLTGYPTAVLVAGKQVRAYVASWIAVNGPVPDGKTLDHQCHTRSTTCAGGPTCRHRRCVRPDHLAPATYIEQQRWRPSYMSPTCPRGHERTEANTAIRKNPNGTTYRGCRKCRTERVKARYVRRERRRLSDESLTCCRGHVRTDANTAIRKHPNGSVYRRCRECSAEDTRARTARMKKERIA